MLYNVSNKISIDTLVSFGSKITKKKINKKDDLFKLLDSLEIMMFLSAVEKKFKIKFDYIKLLNNNKLDLKTILSHIR
jgi:acyl carrier protein|tara:strand:+ start:78 stop:311 length:234 start_codon:yes stop_codon:yes gene_type:complete